MALIDQLSPHAVAQRIVESAPTEYANLSLSSTELRANIRHANLIARAKIVAYKRRSSATT